MQNKHPPTDQRNRSLLKIVSYTVIGLGTFLFVCVLALLLFSDPLVNRFIKPRITKAFAAAYPAYSLRIADMHYSVFTNRFGFDSVALGAADGTFSGTMDPFSVSGISWMHLLWGGSLVLHDFANASVEAHDIVLNLPQSEYRLRCKRLSVSVPQSEMAAESLDLQPLRGDEQFFSGSAFRKTRLTLATRQCTVQGLAWLKALKGESYRAQSIQIRDAVVDILVNKDKPDAHDTVGPFMPNEILSAIHEDVNVDRLNITNGQLKYSERFELNAKPSSLTFDSLEVAAEGIANHGDSGSVFVVRAQTKFANAGVMKVNMTFPVTSPDFSFQYSGSLSGMDLRPINSFVEISDHMRIKSGILEGATYEINVVSGHASGSITGVYKGLSIAAINKNTGSEKGFSDRVTSFIANNFKIRQNNVPGAMKIGRIKYDRLPDDPFFQYAWFSLRTGVRDVLGF
jgi:hypothetical protein